MGTTVAPSLVQAQSTLRKGPWLMDARTTEITIMAERATAGPLTIKVYLDGPAPTAEREVSAVADAAVSADVLTLRGGHRDAGRRTDGTVAMPAATASASATAVSMPRVWTVQSQADATFHELTVRGLIAARRYRYEVSGAGIEPSTGHFSTAPEGFAPFRFVIYGDTRSHAGAHTAIINALVNEGADWALHTGDLVEDGRDEELWQEFFDIERSLLRNTPLVSVIGNHEIVSPTTSGTDRYRRYVHCDQSSPSPELNYDFHWANVHVVLVNAYDDFNDPAQHDWLSSRLASARASADRDHGWVLFATHWGPRSSGPHGDNRHFRIANVDALLRRYHVDLAISGHDHLYERGDDNGLRFIVSGGGGASLYRQRSTNDYSRKLIIAHHYVRVDVRQDSLLTTAIRDDGTVLESCTLLHDRWGCDGPSITPPIATPSATTPPSSTTAGAINSNSSASHCGCTVVGSRGPRTDAPLLLSLVLTGFSLVITRVFARSSSRRVP